VAHDAAAAARGRAEHRHRDARRRGLRPAGDLRRRRGDPDAVAAGGRGHRLQRVPHHGDVLADPGVAADRPEPPPSGRRPDRRVRERLGRLHGHHPEDRGDVPGGAAPLRVRDRGFWQMAQHTGRHPGDGPVRAVPHGARFRPLLRLHRGGNVPVGARALGEHDPHRNAPAGRPRGLPPDRGHGGQGGPLDAAPPRRPPGATVPGLLDAGGRARAASRRRGVVRPVRRPLRRGVGCGAQAHIRPAEGDGLDPRGCHPCPAARGDPRVGRRPGERARVPAAPDGGLRRLPRAHGHAGRQARRRSRGDGHPGEHAVRVHPLGQRRVRRGDARLHRRAQRAERHPHHRRRARRGRGAARGGSR